MPTKYRRCQGQLKPAHGGAVYNRSTRKAICPACLASHLESLDVPVLRPIIERLWDDARRISEELKEGSE